MLKHSRSISVGTLIALTVLAANIPGSNAAPSAPRAAGTSVLVAIRASHHRLGHDRVVFEFSGAVPSRHNVRYVSKLIADPSGQRVPIAGQAILEVTFSPAAAHTTAGKLTVPTRIAFEPQNVLTVMRAGDFEGVLSYGIGLAKRQTFHVFTLTHPSRVVIDIHTAFRTVYKRVYFFNEPRFVAGREPFVTGVLVHVPASTPATGLMDRLFAGPTPAQSSTGLRLLASRATGYTGLSISGHVARVRLTGGCSSGGSTATIAQEITPTLKQLPGVHFVKIYDPSGHTERPTGLSDSIPTCLEP